MLAMTGSCAEKLLGCLPLNSSQLHGQGQDAWNSSTCPATQRSSGRWDSARCRRVLLAEPRLARL